MCLLLLFLKKGARIKCLTISVNVIVAQLNFPVRATLFFTQHCHCNKCREIASLSSRDTDKLGYGFTAGYLTANFNLMSGSDHLDEIIRNNAKLLLCNSCHSLIYGISLDPSKQAGVGVNVNNFHFDNSLPESFKPVRHIWYDDRVVNIHDDLPKYKNAPKEQFGSGELSDKNN